MRIRHAINMGLLGQQRDRFHVYTEARSLAERLELLRGIPGYQGIEVLSGRVSRARSAESGRSGLRVGRLRPST